MALNKTDAMTELIQSFCGKPEIILKLFFKLKKVETKKNCTRVVQMPNEIFIHRATDDTAETSNFLVKNPNTNIKANRKQSELM